MEGSSTQVGSASSSPLRFRNSNDVFADLEQLGLHTHENRALGAVFQKAAKLGWIVKTDRTVPSTRKTRHSGDVRVWASQLQGQPA